MRGAKVLVMGNRSSLTGNPKGKKTRWRRVGLRVGRVQEFKSR